MNWIKALPADSLKEARIEDVRVGQTGVLLMRYKGAIYATETRCPHMRLPLQLGRLSGECTLNCPWHHSAFDLRTGDVEAWAPWPPTPQGSRTATSGSASRTRRGGLPRRPAFCVPHD